MMGYTSTSRMIITVLLLHLIQASQIHTLNYEKFVLDTYRDNCPYSETCTLPSKVNFGYNRQKEIPCCYPCSCEDSCRETQSCCPDVGNSSVLHDESRYTECLSSIYPVDHQRQDNFESIFKRYSTVRTCPSTYPDEDIVSRCTGLSPRALDELVFVSDEFGKIYRNSHCALCNGVDHFTRWHLAIRCLELDENFTRKLSLNLIKRSGCTIWSEAPNIPVLENRRCYLTNIDTCNVTGEWETYDDNIAKACRSGQFGHFQASGWLYKNVFCYICNHGIVTNDILVCTQKIIRINKYPFTALIDFTTVSKIHDPTARCKIGRIYDIYADKCRRLICPINTIPSYGVCLELFESTDGFAVRFGVFLTSSTSLLNSSIEIELVLKSAVFALNGKIENYDRDCRVCSNKIRSEPAMKHLTLSTRISVATSPRCHESNILVIATFLDNNSISLNINEQNYSFFIQLVSQREDNFSSIEFGHPHHLYTEKVCLQTEAHITDIKCPYITITGKDYIEALRNNFIKPNEYYNKYLKHKTDESLRNIWFDICVDEYFSSSSSSRGCSVRETTYFTPHIVHFRNSLMLPLLMSLISN